MRFSQVVREFLLDKEHIHCYIDPLCIGRGYVLSSRRSTVYFFVATISLSHHSINPHCIFGGYTFLSIQLWIRSVFYGSHILLSLDHPSIGMPALGFETCHNICWMFVCNFCQVLWVYTLSWMSTKYFSHQFVSSNFILWGAFCYTSKLLSWISVALSLSIVVSVASSLQLLQVSQVGH